MRGGGSRDDDRVDPAQQLADVPRDVHGRMLARHALADLGVGVAHRRELGVGERRGGADVVLPPRSGPDHPEPQAAHR